MVPPDLSAPNTPTKNSEYALFARRSNRPRPYAPLSLPRFHFLYTYPLTTPSHVHYAGMADGPDSLKKDPSYEDISEEDEQQEEEEEEHVDAPGLPNSVQPPPGRGHQTPKAIEEVAVGEIAQEEEEHVEELLPMHDPQPRRRNDPHPPQAPRERPCRQLSPDRRDQVSEANNDDEAAVENDNHGPRVFCCMM
jgi:hypothetical protein